MPVRATEVQVLLPAQHRERICRHYSFSYGCSKGTSENTFFCQKRRGSGGFCFLYEEAKKGKIAPLTQIAKLVEWYTRSPQKRVSNGHESSTLSFGTNGPIV